MHMESHGLCALQQPGEGPFMNLLVSERVLSAEISSHIYYSVHPNQFTDICISRGEKLAYGLRVMSPTIAILC